MNTWSIQTQNNYYFYDIKSEKIKGMVTSIFSSSIWMAKVYKQEIPFDGSSEIHLGQYMTLEGAKRAVDLYWDIDSKTLLG